MTGNDHQRQHLRWTQMLFLIFAFAAAARVTGAQEFQWGAQLVTSYDIQKIGGTGAAWVSIQDSDGQMYFGCDSLLRFDGEHWTSHSIGRGSTIRGLAFDNERRLWVGAKDDIGYFQMGPEGPGAFVSLRHLLPEKVGPIEDIWVVICTPLGVFFAETDSVLRWDGNKFESWDFPEIRRTNLFYTDGQILATSQNGILRFNGSDWDLAISRAELKTRAVEWVEASGNEYLLGLWNGLRKFRQGTLTGTGPAIATRARGDIFADACRYDASTVAIANIGRGVLLLDNDGSVRRTIGIEEGLPDLQTNSVFVDREGGIWTTTRNHISRISANFEVSFFGAEHGLEGQATDIGELNGRILVLSSKGAAILVDPKGDESARFEDVPNLPRELLSVQCLGPDRVVIAGFGGFFVTDGKTKINVPQPEREAYAIISSHRRHGQYFLLATAGGYLWSFNSEPEKIEGFPSNARGLAEDKAGNLWIGTNTEGLVLLTFESNKYNRASAPSGLPIDAHAVAVVGVNNHIVATSNGRSYVSRGVGHPFIELPRLRGFTPGAGYSHTGAEEFWQIATKSVTGQGQLALLLRHISKGNKFETEFYEIPGLNKLRSKWDLRLQSDLALWISGAGGVLRVPLSAIKPPTPPLQPLLRARFPEEENRPGPDGRPTLPFRANRLAFDWAVTDYERRDQLLFETRLVGLESHWTTPQAGSRREFPFLQEGDYRFEVRTLSPAGLTSSVASWDFSILPPWWRTRWAYASYALAAGLLLVGADRVRIRALRRRTEWLEEQVRARTAELEKANAAKTEFVARVNHDIRNPINGVLGLTLTLEQTPLNDEQRRMTGTIKQCAKFLSSLVEEVLDFAEIESGAIRIRSDRFDLREAVAASVATIDPLARAAGSAVEVEVDPDLPPQLGGDTARVQQILVNFLSNAVKFGAGRPITVSARALHQIGPRLFVRLAVRDRGPGLSAEEQAQLFRKFSRLKFAEEQKIKGTGLGLAVCRLLAERLGGRVGVESSPGAGSEFFLELPFDLAATTVDDGLLSPVATNARVLVVEDEDYNAISLLAMLKGMGFSADRCADGQTALDQLQSERYDIVFLDWELPRLNGIEVARRYRATEPPDRRTLIIATTAYASADKRDACRAAGMDEFVAKPVTPERLTIAIRGHASVFTPATSILVREEPNAPAGPDLSLFAYLADAEGGVEAKVNDFIAACEKELAELGTFATAGRADELRRGAHRFLSQCRFVGATRLAGLALDLEQRSEQPRGAEVRNLLEALRAEFAAFKNELRSSLDARAAAESAPSRSRNG